MMTMTDPSTIQDYLRSLDQSQAIQLAIWMKSFLSNSWPISEIPENWQDILQDHISDLTQITDNYDNELWESVIHFWTVINSIDYEPTNPEAQFLQSIISKLVNLLRNSLGVDLPSHINVHSIANVSQVSNETTQPPL